MCSTAGRSVQQPRQVRRREGSLLRHEARPRHAWSLSRQDLVISINSPFQYSPLYIGDIMLSACPSVCPGVCPSRANMGLAAERAALAYSFAGSRPRWPVRGNLFLGQHGLARRQANLFQCKNRIVHYIDAAAEASTDHGRFSTL